MSNVFQFSTTRRRMIGARRRGNTITSQRTQHLRELAVEKAAESAENDTTAEGAQDELDLMPTPTGVWDLSQEETEARIGAAVDGVWRAYMNASIRDGFERAAKDPKFSEQLARVEDHFERVKSEAQEDEPIVTKEDDMPSETKRTEAILRAVKGGADTAAAVERACGLSNSYEARKLVDELIAEGLIESHGAGRGRRIYLRGHAPAPDSPKAPQTERAPARIPAAAPRRDSAQARPRGRERIVANLEAEIHALDREVAGLEELRDTIAAKREEKRSLEKALAALLGEKSSEGTHEAAS